MWVEEFCQKNLNAKENLPFKKWELCLLQIRFSVICFFFFFKVTFGQITVPIRGQSTTLRSCFYPFTMWVPGTELRSSNLIVRVFASWATSLVPLLRVFYGVSGPPHWYLVSFVCGASCACDCSTQHNAWPVAGYQQIHKDRMEYIKSMIKSNCDCSVSAGLG